MHARVAGAVRLVAQEEGVGAGVDGGGVGGQGIAGGEKRVEIQDAAARGRGLEFNDVVGQIQISLGGVEIGGHGVAERQAGDVVVPENRVQDGGRTTGLAQAAGIGPAGVVRDGAIHQGHGGTGIENRPALQRGLVGGEQAIPGGQGSVRQVNGPAIGRRIIREATGQERNQGIRGVDGRPVARGQIARKDAVGDDQATQRILRQDGGLTRAGKNQVPEDGRRVGDNDPDFSPAADCNTVDNAIIGRPGGDANYIGRPSENRGIGRPVTGPAARGEAAIDGEVRRHHEIGSGGVISLSHEDVRATAGNLRALGQSAPKVPEGRRPRSPIATRCGRLVHVKGGRGWHRQDGYGRGVGLRDVNCLHLQAIEVGRDAGEREGGNPVDRGHGGRDAANGYTVGHVGPAGAEAILPLEAVKGQSAGLERRARTGARGDRSGGGAVNR